MLRTLLSSLRLFLTLTLLSPLCPFAQTGNGAIRGIVKDKSSGEPLPYAKVAVFQNDQLKTASQTDFDGKFLINELPPGKYTVKVRHLGHDPIQINDVVVNSDRATRLNNIQLADAEGKKLPEVETVYYTEPLIDPEGPSSTTIGREAIQKMGQRSAAAIAQTAAGTVSSEDSDGISIRGARGDANFVFIDGIKVPGGSSNLPKAALQEVTVITGGVPANYGDIMGGITSITTRGPSNQYFGSLEGVTSGFYFNGKDPLGYDGKVIGFDKYAYNLLEGMVSGPLLMKKDSTGKKTKKPVLGFFLSGNYTDQLDSRPLANGGGYRLKKEARDALIANPLRPAPSGTGVLNNVEFLRHDPDNEDRSDFEQVPWRMNARSRSISGAGKLDANAGPNVNLTFGGSFAWDKRRLYNYNNSLLNFENFGERTALDWRVYGRFTQRFNGLSEQGEEASTIKSANYSLMVDYSQNRSRFQDARHEDRVFNYGYVGKFETFKIPTYQFNDTRDSLIHNGFDDTLVRFTPSSTNEAFAAATSQYYRLFEGQKEGNFESLDQILQGKALRNGDLPSDVYGIWRNLGRPYNTYGFSQLDQFRVTGSGAINTSNHSISLGFEYEQRWDRSYSGSPNPTGSSNQNGGHNGLWTTARQYMNSHITEIDTAIATAEYFGTYPRITYQRLNASKGVYAGQEGDDAQSFFDYSVRKKLGLNTDGTDFVDIDALDPDFFSVDMFSPDELLNQGGNLFVWRGYDHAGKKVRGNTDIDKYFTEYDKNGNFKRHIGAFQPIYMAGYIMDKFSLEDITFNVGVRVDVFDANQPVMKDKYLLYPAKTVAEVTDLGDHPENMGDDYVVYVDDVQDPNEILGYRTQDTWFDDNGVEIADPSLIQGPNGIAPYLQDPTLTSPTADAFEDYQPQVNFMPRIAFSFPISDEAAFFAHYDILTKRPTTGMRFNPIDYQFMQNRNAIIDNPNLKPERTIDYEVGFQQVLSKTSSLKISAFYKEQRDMVQLINVFQAYPNTYRSYGNRDFGTVKGMTVIYDLRRTGNISMNAAYTLQFANGTGSSAGSALNLVNSGNPNLLTTFPFSYDQRHTFTLRADYRFGSGKGYNGPSLKNGFQLLANTGINLTTIIGSGTPYSRSKMPLGDAFISLPGTHQLDGSPFGSRKPWTYRVELQIDRDFDLAFGKKEEGATKGEGATAIGKKKRTASLNVYFRIVNLFNIINTLYVYRPTGMANDDGYLSAAESQDNIQSQLDEQSFRDYYGIKVQDPFNLGIPRTIRLGARLNF